MDAFENPFSKQLRIVLDSILVLIFITTSFDIILNIKISGFSIRICNLLMFFFSASVFMLSILSVGKFKIKFLGFWSFLIWFLLLLFFVKNSILISRGLGYIFWLAIFFAFIISLSLYVQTKIHFERILIWYIHSFTIVAFLGIVQFLLIIAGVDFFVDYYFMSGIPRIHGFCYEPSYFSTYLIIPWGFHFLLFFTDYHDFKRKIFNQYALIILTFVLFISFSRMGIVAMILLTLSQILNAIKNAILRKRLSIKHFIFLCLIASLSLLILVFALFNFEKFILIFEGLPFLSKYWHSATVRIRDFVSTWQIFIKSPWAGYSLGGIAPAIASLRGHMHITQDVAKHTEGLCVFLEILAASGIIGFIFFIVFLSKFMFSHRILKKIATIKGVNFDYLYFKVHYFLILTAIFQLLLLCMSQNILRNYVWTHFAIINLSFFVLKHHMQQDHIKTKHDLV